MTRQNRIHSQARVQPDRNAALSRAEKILFVLAVTLMVAILLWLGIWLWQIGDVVQDVRADIDAVEALAQAAPNALELDRALPLLGTTRSDLQRLQSTAAPLLKVAPLLGWVPRYGADIQAAPVLLEIGLKLTEAGEEALGPLLPLWETYQAQADTGLDQQELFQQALEILRAAHPQLEDALALALEAKAAREDLDTDELDPRVQRWVGRLDRYLGAAIPGLRGALVLPDLLGWGSMRTWLILVQNEDELRATGGFISGVVRVTFQEGRLVGLDLRDSYQVDNYAQAYPAPPTPLAAYMLADIWVFRDSNWSPDFPTSARAAIALYQIGQGIEADGVLALDQEAIRLLIEALAPLHVEGYDQPITGQNVVEFARQAWAPDENASGQWWLHRKDFMASVLGAALARLQGGLGQDELFKVSSALLASLKTKHMLIYVQDDQVAQVMGEVGWDGALRRQPGDYVMVVDTNMGFNKVNPLIEERIEYAVDLSTPEHPNATLTVHYRHALDREGIECLPQPRYGSTYVEMMERCYWDYLRVYVPSGAEVVAAVTHPIAAQELLSEQPGPAEVIVGPPESGRDVLATFFVLRPRESIDTSFQYTLPPGTIKIQEDEIEYDLVIQKQPGTVAIPVRVRIALPSGAAVTTSVPVPQATEPEVLEYETRLDVDWGLHLELRPVR